LAIGRINVGDFAAKLENDTSRSASIPGKSPEKGGACSALRYGAVT
jgi:hypothetical protein